MKKQVPLYALVIAVALLSISLWQNYSHASAQKQIRNGLLSSSFVALVDISTNLESLLEGIESGTLSYEECENRLVDLSQHFTQLHFSLKTFATQFPPPGRSQNTYAGIRDFAFIGRTLIGTQGSVNDRKYCGITADNAISSQEVQYLKILKAELDTLMDAFASEEDPYRVRENMASSYVNKVLQDALFQWHTVNPESPLYLLME